MNTSDPFYTSMVAMGGIGSVIQSVLDDSSNDEDDTIGNRIDTQTILRTRRPVSCIMRELGAHTRRYYRMEESSFWDLHSLLRVAIETESSQARLGARPRPVITAPNGTIDSSIRLSISIRYFAGGEALDIALVHGVCHAEVFRSVWIVVNAIHNTRELDIEFPYGDYNRQREIAQGFQQKSTVGFGTTVGATDGMLVWIPKPPDSECKAMSCGPKKFYCGRKKKFGLNLQGTCDSHRKFLDVSIGHPGSTSDYLVYVTSPLYYRLQATNALAPGLVLFGDNAYVPSAFMVTPFKGARSGVKDAFNFYHSQLRINIECAFGMLVNRFGILRKPMPKGISLVKTTTLTYALCKLHNFCIDARELHVPAVAPPDHADISIGGGVPMDGDEPIPTQLIGGGEHFDDVDRNVRRQDLRQSRTGANASPGTTTLPQDTLHNFVAELDVRRPTPRHWVN